MYRKQRVPLGRCRCPGVVADRCERRVVKRVTDGVVDSRMLHVVLCRYATGSAQWYSGAEGVLVVGFPRNYSERPITLRRRYVFDDGGSARLGGGERRNEHKEDGGGFYVILLNLTKARSALCSRPVIQILLFPRCMI